MPLSRRGVLFVAYCVFAVLCSLIVLSELAVTVGWYLWPIPSRVSIAVDWEGELWRDRAVIPNLSAHRAMNRPDPRHGAFREAR